MGKEGAGESINRITLGSKSAREGIEGNWEKRQISKSMEWLRHLKKLEVGVREGIAELKTKNKNQREQNALWKMIGVFTWA